MGVGLGRNSPVKLSFTKDNYEALIERHGQWIRWRTASKCSCVKYGTMQPDIHCKICGGRGVTYSYQKSQVVFDIQPLKNVSAKIIEVSERFSDCELIEVYDYNGKRYSGAVKIENYVYLNTESTLEKNAYYTIIMRKNIVNTLKSAEAVKNNMGYYTIPGLLSSQPGTDGVYYSVSGDIVSIGKITDAAGIEYEPVEFRLNQFRIEPTVKTVIDEETGEEKEIEIPITEPVNTENISYIPPFIFALLSQNLSKADIQAVEDSQGDAICSFPYGCDVAQDDVLTVLTGSYVNKEVLVRQNFETDTLGVYFVYDIISCTGIIDGNIVEYKQGTDFILVGTNKIKWLENGNYPEEGETYSISYHVLPTYKVVKEIPMIRTSENQRLPKKCVVKLHTTYSENAGANKQVVGRNGIEGSY